MKRRVKNLKETKSVKYVEPLAGQRVWPTYALAGVAVGVGRRPGPHGARVPGLHRPLGRLLQRLQHVPPGHRQMCRWVRLKFDATHARDVSLPCREPPLCGFFLSIQTQGFQRGNDLLTSWKVCAPSHSPRHRQTRTFTSAVHLAWQTFLAITLPSLHTLLNHH